MEEEGGSRARTILSGIVVVYGNGLSEVSKKEKKRGDGLTRVSSYYPSLCLYRRRDGRGEGGEESLLVLYSSEW